MVPDGEGGAYLTWSDYRDPSRPDEIYVQRMRSDGTPYPAWPVNGVRVTDNYHFDGAPYLAPDGSGGAYLCWDQCCFPPDRVLVQRLTGSGAVAPGWPAGGLAIPSEQSNTYARITADGQGGAIAAWKSGFFEVRALRFVADGPTPVQVALVSAEASPDRVQLVWYGSGAAGVEFAVYRRTASADWQRLATLTADGGGTLRYEDRAVIPGGRYGYRLGYPDGGTETFTAEAWVEVPRGFALALEGLRPNPALGELVAAFALPNADSATLELLDLNGRRLVAHEVGTLGAGSHRLRLDAGRPVPAGIYWLRLHQGARTLVARGGVIR